VRPHRSALLASADRQGLTSTGPSSSTAFAWILWILFTVATVSVIGLAFRSYRRGDKFSGSLA
jgi:hypothetical protein